MKIALCSKGEFSLEKGFTKNRIELADSLRPLGWETILVTKQLLGISSDEPYNCDKYSLALKEFLLRHRDEFDVVLHEYDTLPFQRDLFSENTLFVARPAILALHHSSIKIPLNLKTRISQVFRNTFLKIFGKGTDRKMYFKKIEYCLDQADMIQVQNTKDHDLLVQKGFSPDKITIVGNGITSKRIELFKPFSHQKVKPFVLVFVGTFDFRKGAMDFPFILKGLKKQFPDIKLKLLGTRGLFQTEKEVLRFFPKKYQGDITVLPNFPAEALPELLQDCHLGIFPSYLESFGFGALEMMCAGLPVVAYDAPGPADFILPDLLVPTGDKAAMVEKILSLLKDENELMTKSRQARERVIHNYCWEDLAIQVDRNYRTYLGHIRKNRSSRKYLIKH